MAECCYVAYSKLTIYLLFDIKSASLASMLMIYTMNARMRWDLTGMMVNVKIPRKSLMQKLASLVQSWADSSRYAQKLKLMPFDNDARTQAKCHNRFYWIDTGWHAVSEVFFIEREPACIRTDDVNDCVHPRKGDDIAFCVLHDYNVLEAEASIITKWVGLEHKGHLE